MHRLLLAALLVASPSPLGDPGSTTQGLALSHGRALYAVTSTAGNPVYIRDVPSGAATQVSPSSESFDLAGPYVALTRPTSVARELVYGRLGGPYRTWSFSGAGQVQSSAHRFVLSRDKAYPRLVNAATGNTVTLLALNAVVTGDYLLTVEDVWTQRIAMRDIATGVVKTVYTPPPRTLWCGPGVCTPKFLLAGWGDEAVYSSRDSRLNYLSGLYDYSSETLTPLPMLSGDPGVTSIAYHDGLLLVAGTGGVRLYDLRHDTSVLVDASGTGDVDLDGHFVGWHSGDQQVVEDVHDFLPSYDPTPRYQTGLVPPGFGPGRPLTSWQPRMYVTQDVTWRLDLHAGDASGPVVRTFTGTSAHGELGLTWDGTDANGAPRSGWHTWVLTGTTPGGQVLRNAEGTADGQTGRVYVSRTPPTYVPTVHTQPVAIDAQSVGTGRVYLSWTWAVEDGMYSRVSWSVDGGAYQLSNAMSPRTTFTLQARPGHTYRVRVAEADPAGRYGTYSAPATSVAPYDDASGSWSGSWARGTGDAYYLGTYHASATPGAFARFTARGTAFWLYGGTGPDHGQFQVSVDGGAWSGWYDTYAATRKVRQQLYARGGLADTTHTVTIRLRGTPGRPAVSVDAFACRR